MSNLKCFQTGHVWLHMWSRRCSVERFALATFWNTCSTTGGRACAHAYQCNHSHRDMFQWHSFALASQTAEFCQCDVTNTDTVERTRFCRCKCVAGAKELRPHVEPRVASESTVSDCSSRLVFPIPDSRQNYGISPGMWDFPFAGTVSFYVEYVGLFCL